MENSKEPKWELSDAINSGKKSILLTNDYGKDLEPRLKTGELEQHKANVDELELRKSGQKENLTIQVSNTQGQEAAIAKVNKFIVSIRNMVKSHNPTNEISKAFGIGDTVIHTVSGVTSAANIILKAYANYGTWSKDAGIIEADITLLTNLLKSLTTAENLQDTLMYVRKSKTMDKNTLQRSVEDEVTRLSAMGALHFIDNPSLVSLFEDLIPAFHRKPKAKNGENKTA